jgi:phosphatidylglycerophosphate synthase
VFDTRLRERKDRLLAPLVATLAPRTSPAALTFLSLAVGVAAAVAAAVGLVWASVTLFLVSRLTDGLDGAVARHRHRSSELGAFADLLGDVVVYAAVPLGVAVAAGDARTWAAAAVLLATFYVNVVSWMFLAAVAARRSVSSEHETRTTIPMPAGLVEGTETIVVYTLILAFPTAAITWFWMMAGLVAITVLQRVGTARRWLST